MKKNILVTGGTGFLGCHLARKLLSEGFSVTLLDIAPLTASDLQEKVRYVKVDIRDKKALEKAMEQQDYVVHAAAALPIQRKKDVIFSINVDGTKNVLESACKAGVKRLVFISTTAVYGVPKHLPEKENSPINPIGYYGESKVLAEKLCLAYQKKGLSINIIRPKTFLGPERLGVFSLWFEAIYTGKKIVLLGNGENPYQLLAVSDVVDAIVKALVSKTDGEIFNIGAKSFTTWRKDLGAVIKYAKSKTSILSLPVLPSQLLLALLEQLNLSPISAWHYKTLPVPSYVSTEKAKKYLHWEAKKSNQDLLLENYKWYEKNRKKILNATGATHRVGWNFGILNLIKLLP